jgi:uncharacterized phage protein (TIGR02220 family)
MLLLVCASCKDAFNLSAEVKICNCGLSFGKISEEGEVYASLGSRVFHAEDQWLLSDSTAVQQPHVVMIQEQQFKELSPQRYSEKEICTFIINYLNRAANTSFSTKFPSAHTKLILDRMKEHKCTVDDVCRVIEKKAAEWRQTEYAKYLRPATLFNKTKFANYIGQLNTSYGQPKSNRQGVSSLFDALAEAKGALPDSSK